MPHIAMALIKTPADLLVFNPEVVNERIREGDLLSSDEIARLFTLAHAFYRYLDVPAGMERLPHVLLTSGMHSDKYFDCPLVLQYTKLCQIMACQLIYNLRQGGHLTPNPTVVIGSSYAAITLSYEVARQLGCRHIYTEKGPEKSKTLSRYPILPNDRVLMVEELITTLSTAEAQEAAIMATNPPNFTMVPVLGVMVNRSAMDTFHDRPIVSVLDTRTSDALRPSLWNPTDCPLCQAGSILVQNVKASWTSLFVQMTQAEAANATAWICSSCQTPNLDTATLCQHCHVARQMA